MPLLNILTSYPPIIDLITSFCHMNEVMRLIDADVRLYYCGCLVLISNGGKNTKFFVTKNFFCFFWCSANCRFSFFEIDCVEPCGVPPCGYNDVPANLLILSCYRYITSFGFLSLKRMTTRNDVAHL